MASYARTLTGAQPGLAPIAYSASTATYASTTVFYTGISPGSLTALAGVLRLLTGTQPAATGTLTRHLYVTLGGVQPSAEGTVDRRAGLRRSLDGVQAAASGTLTAYRFWIVYVIPGHEQGTSPDEYVHVQYLGETYQHHQSEQPAADSPGYLLVPYADATVLYADPAVVYVGRPVPEATGVPGSSAYRHGQTDMVQSTYVAKQHVPSRMETR